MVMSLTCETGKTRRIKAASGIKRRKNALDHSGNLVDPLATRFSHLVHHGRSHSHSFDHRARGDSDQSPSRPKGPLEVLEWPAVVRISVLTKGDEQHESERDKKIGNAFTRHLADRDGFAPSAIDW
jgi:hypothetical protein